MSANIIHIIEMQNFTLFFLIKFIHKRLKHEYFSLRFKVF